MRFLLDASASARALRPLLEELGHDVTAIVDIDRQASDESILELAVAEERILITLDKDFGDLVFARGHAHGCIIRLFEGDAMEQAEAMRDLLENTPDALQGSSLIVVGRGTVRIRRR